jgi:hypothetical protein
MSIFYNAGTAESGRMRSMKQMNISKIAALIGAGTVAVLCAHGQTSTPSAAGLEPIAFLTAHEWDAKLPDSPDGKKKKIHARFIWAQNRQAIRISNELVTDGKAAPYIDGLYAWDPHQRVIVFWYVEATGGLTEGTVKLEEGKLVHEFQETEPDGKTADYVSRVTPHGTEAWDNEIFAGKGKDLTPMVKVRYEPAQK